MPNPTTFSAFGYVGMAKAGAAYGTQQQSTAPSVFFPIESESLKNALTSSFYRNGTSQALAYSVVNSEMWSGTYRFPLTSNFGGWLIWAAMGGTDTVTGGADPFTHNFGFRNDLAWFNVERAFANQTQIERITDVKFDNLRLEGKGADIAWLSADLVGCNVIAAQDSLPPATIIFDGDAPFMFRDGTFVINGTTFASVIGFTLDVKRGIKPYYTTHVYPDFLIPTAREVDVTLDVLFDGTTGATLYNNILKGGATTGVSKNTFSGSLVLTFNPGGEPNLATPGAPILTDAGTGGTNAAGTYNYRITATNAAGETLAGPESIVSITILINHKVNIAWNAVNGATGYKVYGRTPAAELLMTTLVGAQNTTFIDTGSITPSGALPGANTATQATHTVALSVPDLRELTATAPLNVAADAQLLHITGKAQRPANGGDELTWTIANNISGAYNT